MNQGGIFITGGDRNEKPKHSNSLLRSGSHLLSSELRLDGLSGVEACCGQVNLCRRGRSLGVRGRAHNKLRYSEAY